MGHSRFHRGETLRGANLKITLMLDNKFKRCYPNPHIIQSDMKYLHISIDNGLSDKQEMMAMDMCVFCANYYATTFQNNISDEIIKALKHAGLLEPGTIDLLKKQGRYSKFEGGKRIENGKNEGINDRIPKKP